MGVSSYSLPQVVRANPERSRFSLRKEGQVAWLESPNGLDAIRRVSITGKNVKPKNLQLKRRACPPFAHRSWGYKSVRRLKPVGSVDEATLVPTPDIRPQP